ncbi:MAG: cache domain-containing protein [Spirochaetales bacterium]
MTLSTQTRFLSLRALLTVAIAVAAASIVGCAGAEPTGETILHEAYERLDQLRGQKEQQLYDYFDHIEDLVQSVSQDQELVQAFAELRSRFLGKPVRGARSVGELENAIRGRYLDAYQVFFDLHFIEAGGDVFYSIRKQDDLFHNVFEGELNSWQLAGLLDESSGSAAVDFHYAEFSAEPSAFFAEPVRYRGEHAGWVVFQFASARLAEIFEFDSSLGQTGEVFLVNEQHFMLTQSALTASSSILEQTLSAENIESKFAAGEGHKVITDYRGYEALSSFAVCEVMGLRWLLIAKIDKAEVLTEAYLKHEDTYYPRMREELRQAPIRVAEGLPPRPTRTVHLDRFERITQGGSLFTPGVSTCTAIVISLPGEFAYLAHVSPYDLAYGGTKTDLIHTILHRIREFEVPDSRVRELEVVVVTPQIRYSESIVHELAEAGIFLSQIRFLKNPKARCADVFYEFETNRTSILWCYGNEFRRTELQLAEHAADLASVFGSLL